MNTYTFNNDEVLNCAGRFVFRCLPPLISYWHGERPLQGLDRSDLFRRALQGSNNQPYQPGWKKELPRQVPPMNSVREYFQHFRVLEIDYTFYAPLIEKGSSHALAPIL